MMAEACRERPAVSCIADAGRPVSRRCRRPRAPAVLTAPPDQRHARFEADEQRRDAQPVLARARAQHRRLR